MGFSCHLNIGLKLMYNIDKAFGSNYSLVISWFISIVSCITLTKHTGGKQCISALGKINYAQ